MREFLKRQIGMAIFLIGLLMSTKALIRVSIGTIVTMGLIFHVVIVL